MHFHIAINIHYKILMLSRLFIVSQVRRQHFNSIFKRAECFILYFLFFWFLSSSLYSEILTVRKASNFIIFLFFFQQLVSVSQLSQCSAQIVLS